jgi:formiminotetrahydrofolate cyclodeaminase
VLIKSEKLRAKFTAIIDEDMLTSKKAITAFQLPQETYDQKGHRTATIQEAIKLATLVLLKLMELCAEALELVKIIVEKGDRSSLSDIGIAALMLQAGCEGAALNVKINLDGIQDAAFVETQRNTSNSILTNVNDSSQLILYRINEKLLSY